MAETESITVAEVSDGPCGSHEPGRAVDLPVVELLTGRGFVTGKSGAGKSNSASVITEKLLDNGFGMLIVDVDGEYYGLKEEYEVLHAGADDECDIQVTTEHAEKLATLALEQNVPIILDMSSFLDEEEGEELLTAVARQLFAKEKKLKQPFLMLVEEVHEYIPQKGSVGECGKMLIKISKRGRKHGLGIVGISQRPADVKKDFITQCDWLVWHRLTWNNDTKVVSRVLDSDYAAAVEDLADGEAFMMTDWTGEVRRVQFHRKKTFDAGATPGLDDFERPDLKSVSDDLVSELQEISQEEQERETRVAELREELDRKNSRIAELEAELQDARDMQRMAEQFTQALVEHVEGSAPGRTERERMRARREGPDLDSDPSAALEPDDASVERVDRTTDDGGVEMTWPGAAAATADGTAGDDEGDPATDGDGMFGGFDPTAFGTDDAASGNGTADAETEAADGKGEATDEAIVAALADSAPMGETSGAADPADPTRGFDGVEDDPLGDRATDAFAEGNSPAIDGEFESDAAFARELADEIHDLPAETRQMLRYYRDHGPGTPMDALFAAGGSDDRTAAYARNRTLRMRGLIEHVGRGRYEYRLPELLSERTDGDHVEPFVEQVERSLETAAEDARATDDGGPGGRDSDPGAASGAD